MGVHNAYAGATEADDESWGIDNVRVAVHETSGGGPTPLVPELASLALVGVGAVAVASVIAMRRR